MQEAVAVGFQREYDAFGREESYFKQLPTLLQTKRSRLAECLRNVGLQPYVPEGGYFMITDISNLSEVIYTHNVTVCVIVFKTASPVLCFIYLTYRSRPH